LYGTPIARIARNVGVMISAITRALMASSIFGAGE
jgi:hypothetical protein